MLPFHEKEVSQIATFSSVVSEKIIVKLRVIMLSHPLSLVNVNIAESLL